MVARNGGTPVAFFEELYAIVVGLGLALAVEQVIDLDRTGIPVVAEHLVIFLAYLNIAFALAHSSVRYLQLAYGEREVGELTKGRVIGDLVLGIGQFLWLMALSFLITRPTVFAVGVIGLLIGRPLRDWILAMAGRPRLEFDRKVATIHLLTIAAVLVSIGLAAMIELTEEWIVRAGMLGASVLFGLGLYVYAFGFFFPAVESAD